MVDKTEIRGADAFSFLGRMKEREQEDYKVAWNRWASKQKQEEGYFAGLFLCPACGMTFPADQSDEFILHWWQTSLNFGGIYGVDGQPGMVPPPPSEIEVYDGNMSEIPDEPAGDPQLRKTMREYFEMYDADGGGTMNEYDELYGCTLNLCLELKSQKILKAYNKPELIKACEAVDISDDNEYDFETYARWFVNNFMPDEYRMRWGNADDMGKDMASRQS